MSFFSDDKNFRINHIINFMEISNNFKNNNKYNNLLKDLKNIHYDFDYNYHYSFSDPNFSEDILNNIIEVENEMNIDNSLTKVTNQLALLMTLQYNFYKEVLENGDHYGIKPPEIENGTLFIASPLALPISILNEDNVNEITSFYNKYPELHNGNITEDLNHDKHLEKNIKLNFFKNLFDNYRVTIGNKNHCSSIDDLNNFDYKIMDFLKNNQQFATLLLQHIKINNKEGSYSEGEHSLGKSQNYMIAMLDTSDILTLTQNISQKNK
jgi:hypothetical protein